MLPSDTGRGAQMLDEGLDAVAEALAPGVTEDPLLMRRHASGTGAAACVGGLSSAPPPSPVASSPLHARCARTGAKGKEADPGADFERDQHVQAGELGCRSWRDPLRSIR